MSGKVYVDMDINKLFEANSIKEIEKIQKKIQVESDWKKVELRTLVGERYRDLIQAADTIAEMKLTTESVIERIGSVENTFKALQQKYLIGFKIDPCDKKIAETYQCMSDTVIVQIKILMDIPEHIWSAIDNQDFLRASQLFILAQHINYDIFLTVGQANLAEKYPIVSKQWSIITNFRRIISEECHQTLQLVDLSAEVAANCLASLALIEKVKSPDLLEKLINLRCKAIASIVKNESSHSVRHRIKLSVKMLYDTVALIHLCFIKSSTNQFGIIAQHINAITDQEVCDILFQFDLNNELIKKHLPAVAKAHKLFSKSQFIQLSSSEIHEKFNQWLIWIKNLSIEIVKLLHLVTSVRGIYNIREESISINLPENWTNMWKDLCHPMVDFWTEYFHPLLTTRVKEIINERWSETIDELKINLKNFLIKINNDKFDYPEHDLRWFIWKDSPADIPQKLFKSNSLDTKRSLLMKARGYSPNLVNLCEKFDGNLKIILSDIELYLYETEKLSPVVENLMTINLSSIFDKFNDRVIIQEDLQRVSTIMMDTMILFIREECLIDKPEFGLREINVIVTTRFLQALTVLCPNLNKCFTLSKISGLTISNVKWQAISDRVKEESSFIWSLWAKQFMARIKDEHSKTFFLNDCFDGLKVTTIISEWERVTIEEEAEEGKRIKSEILVPYQPSLPLQKFLASVMKDLNKILPHTVPRKVIQELVENIVEELFFYYENVLKNCDLRQKQAFQVLLDIKYIALLMVPRENKKLVDKSQELCANVFEKIDPFDSDVFSPFIHINVKKSVQRSLLIFGNLVPHLEQLHSVLGARSELGDSGKSIINPPGVLAICTGAPWFPPLAITAPSRNLPLIAVTIPDKVQRKRSPVKEHKRSDSTGATIKSGAAAFFGAMGSDWFSAN